MKGCRHSELAQRIATHPWPHGRCIPLCQLFQRPGSQSLRQQLAGGPGPPRPAHRPGEYVAFLSAR
eukprot:scaffold287582_cov39-Prasinocladus_malaysianus.AAC.2